MHHRKQRNLNGAGGAIMTVRDVGAAVRKILDGDLTLFGGPQVEEAIAGRLRAAQIAILSRFTPAIMLANIFNASVLVVAFWGTRHQAFAVAWGFITVSFSAYIYIRRRYARAYQKGRTASKKAIRRAIANAFLLGLMWAMLPVILFPSAAPSGQIIVISLSIGMLCGGALALSSIPAAGLAFVTPLAFSSAVALAQSGEMVFRLVIGLLIVYAAVLMRTMFIYASQSAVRFISEIEHEMAARTDALTQLPNRVAFMDRLGWIIDRVNRFGESHCVLFLDLDRFKEINDTYGHGGGDEFLIQAASRLRISVREVDFVTRISGDEFAIIISGAGSSETIAEIAERIKRSFAIPFRIQEQPVLGSVTIGIAMLPDDGSDAETILQKADEALYAAKRDQRGTYRFCDVRDEEKIAHRNAVLRELKRAIAHESFHLEFQPTMDVDNGLTTGFEALLRWKHPELGMISPAQFVPLAEEAGLIHEIGEWVLRRAIEEAATWPDHLRVSINVSAIQFRTLEIAAIIERCIGATDIAAERIEIEVTESMILADLERAQDVLSKLRQIGVRIAFDDFGKGYSSLIQLIRLPIDRIKIDRFFISQLEASEECRKMVKAIVRLARDLKIDVTAEGVETDPQLHFLKSVGCREAQGFLISRPVTDVRHSGLTASCFPAAQRAA